MNNNYENKILDAIQTLVDNAVSKAGYDKTIKAVVSKCVNESTGKYVVKYQDSTFYAYSNDLDSIYSGGTPVYVLVPGNDMSQTKTILGSVDKLGTEYITLSESNAAYQEIGTSIVTPNGTIPGISSYKSGGDSETIYDRTAGSNPVTVDTTGANIYFQKAQYIEIGGTFTTQLNEEQKRQGNYGLVFDIDFKDGDTITNKKYVLDIDSMTGNPYSYNLGSTQTAVYEIDGEHFYRLNSITLECKNFPHSATPYTDDIFVKDIILKGLTPLTRDELATNSLTFITKQGTYFHAGDTEETLKIETEVRINRRVIPVNTGLLRYYWFKENSKIGLTSPGYLPFGGPGWECVNSYNVIDETNNVRDYITDADSLTVVKSENTAKENEYKCVVIYNNEIQVEKNIIIYNRNASYTVILESDQGNYFKYNEGNPTLTCSVSPTGIYTYVWTETDSSNRTVVLTETNNTYSVQLGSIANFSKFTCSAFDDEENFVGKADIVITNSWDKEDNSYALVMENGDQIFKYNEKGIAPTNKSLERPIVLKPLQFVLYDELGHQVDDNKIAATDVTWYIPKDNTMIIKPSGELPEEDGYYVYKGQKTLNIDIASIYNSKYLNNIIKLKVRYNDRVLNTQSELAFLKEGEIGSNGTDFVCRIVPNVDQNAQVPTYPIFTANMSTNPVVGDMNYERPSGQSDKWFKVQLYKDGIEIYTGIASGTSQESKAVTVEWSMLKNNYGKYNNITIADSSSFTVNSSTGAFTYVDLDDDLDRAANIVKATITYDGATYYATMPIILVQAINASGYTYDMELVENTGFRYVMYTTDGLNPIYDSSNPFALKVYETYDSVKTDITDSVHYDWFKLGKIYNGTTWVAEDNFILKSAFTDTPTANCRPIEKFSGLSVNNALKCVVSDGGVEFVRIYLPVHFYLNRFGNAALNGWDGNHVEINSNGGFILAPQIGAGKKDSNNAYTGVFMGTVREGGSSSEEVGLFGYNKGERTIALDAEDGSARFGKTGQGQIVIDPGAESAKIYSDDFRVDYTTPDQMNPPQSVYTEGFKYIRIKNNGDIILLKQKPAGTTPLADDEYRIGDSFKAGDRVWVNGDGLEIDLNDPHIVFGNGNFRVDSDGQVYATGFVTVKELEAGDYNIPGTNIFDVEYATNIVQFETNAQLYPIHSETKSITCKCKYKDEYTDNYTVQLIDDNGNVVPYHDSEHLVDWDGIDITISKVGQVTTINFEVDINSDIESTVLSYKFRFTYPTGLVIEKIFNVNLVVKGTSIAVKGEFASTAAMLDAVAQGTITPTLGDSYIIDRELWIYTNDSGHGGTSIDDWYDAGEFQGEPGAPGADGEDAKQLYLTSSAEAFTSSNSGSSYSPNSITITPFFQNTTFQKWQLSSNGGVNWSDLDLADLPTGITYNNNTKALTIANNCEEYTSSISVLSFKCLANERYSNNEYYWDVITVARIKNGEPGLNGNTIWVTSDDPTTQSSKYIFNINDLDGPNKTPVVGEIIIWDSRYQCPISVVNSTTVEVNTSDVYDMRGPAGNNTATVNLYKRTASAPSKPYTGAGSDTYTFSTHQLGHLPTGWDYNVPAASEGTLLYISSAVAYGNTDIVSISNSSWSTPEPIAENGTNGNDGTSPLLAYLTNEVQSFAASIGNVEVSTDLYVYRGDTAQSITIQKVGNVNATGVTSYTDITNISWLQFKIDSTYTNKIWFKTKSNTPQSQSGQIAIEYLVSGESSNRTIYFTYSTTTKGKDALGLNIEPSALLFKTADGGTTYEPTSITLTPNPQNTTFGSWYYNGTQITTTGGGSATNINGVSLNTSTNVLTIVPSSTEFNSYQSLTFEGRNSDGTIKDRATITRLANANNMWVRYSIDEPTQDSDMQTTPTSSTKYIGVYNGPSETAPTHYTDYVWSKYIGESGNGINSITYKYKATDTQSAPDASETGWETNIANTTFSATNKFLWQKEVIDYTLITDKTTVSLIAVWGEKGADTLNVILTNEAQVFAGDTTKAIGNRSYYTDVKGYVGAATDNISIVVDNISGGASWITKSVSNDGGTTKATTGTVTGSTLRVYFDTAANTTTSDLNGEITIPITLNGETINKVFSYSTSLKGAKGEDGDDGNNTATISLYTRSASAQPSKPYSSGAVTYTFASQALSGTLPSGWSRTVPTGTNPLWVSSVSVTANTATVDIGYDSWSTPTKMAQNGTDGNDGYNTATISLYQRAENKPTVTYQNNLTYTFSSHSLDTIPSGWSITAPTTDGNPLWVSYVSVSSRNATVSIASSSWTEAVAIAEDGQDGQDGNDGADGYNTATISMYGRFDSSSTPSAPYSSAVTYTFSTQGLSANPGTGWYRTAASIPSTENGKPLYVSSASVSANTATVSIAANKWSTPYIIAEDGSDGEDAVTLKIVATGTTVFKNNSGSVTLQAHVYQGTTDLYNNTTDAGACALGTIYWYKDGSSIGTASKTYTVNASNVDSLSYVTCQLEERS